MNKQEEERMGRGRVVLVALLLVLALTAFVTASVHIINITEWRVHARNPPIVKERGADVATGFVNVTLHTAPDGTNRTLISITGFIGDITKYDEAIKVCNRDTAKSYEVRLAYEGVLEGNWDHVHYLKLGIGAHSLTINSATPLGTKTPYVTLGPGACVSVSAEVLVKMGATPCTYLIKLKVNVEARTPP